MSEIRAISLWQPWASLIFADGTPKKHETRSWAYPLALHRQEVAIHAAKVFPARRHITAELHVLCLETFGCQYHETLPRGAVLGTVRLSGCVHTHLLHPEDDDAVAGDWSAGRFAWELQGPAALREPLPWKGKQGWFSVPAGLLGRTDVPQDLFA